VPTPVAVEEGPLDRPTRAAAAALCGRAFRDDPFFRFLLPSDARREAALVRLHSTVLAHLGPSARLAVARGDGGRVLGVSAWLPPGGFPPPPGAQVAQIPATLAAFWRTPRSIAAASRVVRVAMRSHLKEPHWYLQLLAVEPDVQRSGVGTALMAPALERVDADHVASYLETQNDENVAYYARFGFALDHRIDPVEGAPALLALRRDAR
jgi:GNAT superfamily N-acetyltransferase